MRNKYNILIVRILKVTEQRLQERPDIKLCLMPCKATQALQVAAQDFLKFTTKHYFKFSK